MTEHRPELSFAPYGSADLEACLALFDANCPAFFAPNERADYEAFLARLPEGYLVCRYTGKAVGAFGLMDRGKPGIRDLNWILIDPTAQRLGIGSAMMREAARHAAQDGIRTILIAASQHSAPFFARFGARESAYVENGWGSGMHRIEMAWEQPAPRQGA